MATRYAVASGNWSAVGTWDGGTTIPSSTDDVYANNFNVSINQSITVNSLKKTSLGSPVIATGGGFTVTTAATVTITAGIATTDNTTNSTPLLSINAGSASVTIAGGGINGMGGTSRLGIQVESGYTGTLTIGNAIVGGTVSTAFAVSVLSGTVICSAAITGGTSAPAISIGGVNAIVTASAAVTAGAGGASNHGISMSAGQLNLNGTVTGGTAGSNGVNISGGNVRVDALLVYGPAAPIQATGGTVQFKRTGATLGMQAPSDDNWPAATGAAIVVERYTTGNPAPANVRSGTTFGPGGTSTGTLAVPPAASVASGVPVDNTTGTAALKLSDLAAVTGAQIAAALA